MAEPGYSGTPLPKKLGLKDGQKVLFIAPPGNLQDLKSSREFAAVVEAGWDAPVPGDGYDFIQLFTTERMHLETHATALMEAIKRDGMIWVSWPKRASKVETDMTEDVVRDVVLPIGLVDVKVCAVDEIWSGLKLVIRKELR